MQKFTSLGLGGLAGRTALLKLALLGLASLLAGAAWAQPANDGFSSAIAITGLSGSTSGTNNSATLEVCESNAVPTDDNGIADVDNSVWYSWTATTNGTMEVDTIGSYFDTVLSVYTTPTPSDLCDPNLMFITADDNSGEINDPLSEPTSQLYFTAVAGMTYYIAVEGNADDPGYDSGYFALNWTLVPEPTNDYFTNATVLTNDYPDFYEDSNVGATTEPGEPTYGGLIGASVWYQWTAPTNGVVTFDAYDLADLFNTELLVYTGNSVSNLTLITIGNGIYDAETSFTATQGEVFAISVAGDYGAAGPFELDWDIYVPPVPPTNDDFSTPTVLTGDSGSTNVDNTYATAETGEPSHAGFPASHSVWYQWTAPSDGEVTLDTIGSLSVATNYLESIDAFDDLIITTNIATNNLDTVLAVYTGNSVSTLSQVAANDDLYPRAQFNYSGQNIFTFTLTTNAIGGGRGGFGRGGFGRGGGCVRSDGYYTTVGELFNYEQPYPGPSGLRFNATAGKTYYFAVDTKSSSLLYESYYGYEVFGTIREHLVELGLSSFRRASLRRRGHGSGR